MKDLVEILLKSLAGYVPMLISVITTPNQSVLKLIANDPERLNKALLFVGITLAIGFLFQAPLLKTDQDFVTVAGAMLAFKILAILAFSGVIMLAFRLVGGKGSFETTLCAYLYIISPLYLLFVILNVINIGILSTHDPEWAVNWRSGQGLTDAQIQDLVSTSPLKASGFMMVFIMQALGTPVWFAMCWRSLRDIHQVSSFRSSLAFVVSVVVCYVVFFLSVIIMRGLYGGGLPPFA